MKKKRIHSAKGTAKFKAVSFRHPDLEALKHAAREEGLSLNSLLTRLVDEYLFNHEEYHHEDCD